MRCCYFTFFPNINDLDAVFGSPGFNISYVTPTFDLKNVVFFANYKCCCWKMYAYWYEVGILRLTGILGLVWCLINFKSTTHPACDVVATSHLGLIQVETSRTMLRRHHEVATGASMRRTYLRRL